MDTRTHQGHSHRHAHPCTHQGRSHGHLHTAIDTHKATLRDGFVAQPTPPAQSITIMLPPLTKMLLPMTKMLSPMTKMLSPMMCHRISLMPRDTKRRSSTHQHPALPWPLMCGSYVVAWPRMDVYIVYVWRICSSYIAYT